MAACYPARREGNVGPDKLGGMHVLGTAGHVDHGKSTLVERLTGIDPDRFAEEKRRGLTIDLGFAWLTLPSGREVGLIDVPGHERFIKNMLSGAGGVSVCLFVVAANEGWKPQSAEHLAILDILGVRHGVVAVTKADLVDEETLELGMAEVEEKLASSSLSGIPIVPCSALTGAGLEDLVRRLDEALDAAPAAPDRDRPRLWIDRVFTIAGSGTVVTGTLMGGRLRVGDEVEIAPEGRRARVRSVQSHKKTVEEVGPGNRVALNLAGLERQGAERGNAIVRPRGWRATSRMDALVRVVSPEIGGREQALTEKGAHLLYVGSAETPVRIKLLDGSSIAPGDSGFAQLYLRDPLPLQTEDRFVLRDAGRVMTVGGGVVLDPLPAPAKRGDSTRRELLRKLVDASATERLHALLEAAGDLDAGEALTRSGADVVPTDIGTLGTRLVSRARLEQLQNDVSAALKQRHAERPLERAVPREAVRAELELETDVFDALLASMTELSEEGAGIRLASHQVGLTPEQQKARDALLRRIDEAGFQPPLASELGVDPALLRSLTESAELVRIESFYLTSARADEARKLVRERIEQRGPVTVAQIRDLLGTTRKYAVPLCEWLDDTGATLRRGDVRLLGPKP
jgi:selenocysteine-specific elongation factor